METFQGKHAGVRLYGSGVVVIGRVASGWRCGAREGRIVVLHVISVVAYGASGTANKNPASCFRV
jgi:hypothetical protein